MADSQVYIMKSNNVLHKSSVLLVCLLFSTPLLANELGGSIAVLSGKSDNALKSNENKIDERQDELQLNVSGDYTNEAVHFEAKYKASAMRFAEDSQENEEFLQGDSSLLFGKAHHPAELLITHSRKTLLDTPDEIALTNNQDEREIVSLSPTLRTKIGTSDSLFITGTATQVSYLQNQILDSARTGATLGWVRGISSIQSFRVVAQQTDVEFDNFNGADYTYSSAVLVYATQLRYLSYSLKVGHNESNPEIGANYNGPTYGVSIGYKSGFHEINLESNQAITDSSLGGGNSPSIDGVPNSDGSRPNSVDQIERLNTELRWETFILCDQCNLFASIYQRDEDYLALEQTAKTQGVAAGFSYRLSKASTVSMRSSKNRQRYTQLDIGNDYDLRLSSIEYSYRFISGVGLRLFAQQEKRTGDVLSQRYVENYFGGGVDYAF